MPKPHPLSVADEVARRVRIGAMHWAVTVERDGEKIVTIESNCLSGREISAEDEETIRQAAHHLLAFIGDPNLESIA